MVDPLAPFAFEVLRANIISKRPGRSRTSRPRLRLVQAPPGQGRNGDSFGIPALRAGIHPGPEMLEGDADLGLERFASGGGSVFRQPEAFVREFLDESHGLVFGEIAAADWASFEFCVRL